jgi:hypothetical protein
MVRRRRGHVTAAVAADYGVGLDHFRAEGTLLQPLVRLLPFKLRDLRFQEDGVGEGNDKEKAALYPPREKGSSLAAGD